MKVITIQSPAYKELCITTKRTDVLIICNENISGDFMAKFSESCLYSSDVIFDLSATDWVVVPLF